MKEGTLAHNCLRESSLQHTNKIPSGWFALHVHNITFAYSVDKQSAHGVWTIKHVSLISSTGLHHPFATAHWPKL